MGLGFLALWISRKGKTRFDFPLTRLVEADTLFVFTEERNESYECFQVYKLYKGIIHAANTVSGHRHTRLQQRTR